MFKYNCILNTFRNLAVMFHVLGLPPNIGFRAVAMLFIYKQFKQNSTDLCILRYVINKESRIQPDSVMQRTFYFDTSRF